MYFIPSHPNSSTALPALTERLRVAFPDEDLIPVGRWNLDQKLMRDTPSLVPSPTNTAKQRYMQFLKLTHYPNHGFVYTSEPPEKPLHSPNSASPNPGTAISPSASLPASASMATTSSQTSTAADPQQAMVMTTLPSSSFGMLFHHFTYACQPFWCHRLTVAVSAGIIYDVGDFRVRIGDVRQTFPTGRVRGTVVEIEWRGPSVVETVIAARESEGEQETDSGIDIDFSVIEEADVDAEYAATAVLIREFWARVSVDGAREAILVPGVGKEVKDQLRRYRAGKVKKAEDVALNLGGVVVEEDPDPSAGADLARQYMEVLRFNR